MLCDSAQSAILFIYADKIHHNHKVFFMTKQNYMSSLKSSSTYGSLSPVHVMSGKRYIMTRHIMAQIFVSHVLSSGTYREHFVQRLSVCPFILLPGSHRYHVLQDWGGGAGSNVGDWDFCLVWILLLQRVICVSQTHLVSLDIMFKFYLTVYHLSMWNINIISELRLHIYHAYLKVVYNEWRTMGSMVKLGPNY